MALSASELKVGDTHEEVVVDDLSRTQLVMYSGASGDYNPLHTDDLYCKEAAGYPGVFAHGMLSMGLTGKMLTNFVGDGRLKKYGVRFTNQVWPGDTLTGKAVVEAIREDDGDLVVDVAVETVNQNGDKVVIGTGDARLRMLRLSDGEEVWSRDLGTEILSSPAVGGGLVVVGTHDGIVAFGTEPRQAGAGSDG